MVVTLLWLNLAATLIGVYLLYRLRTQLEQSRTQVKTERAEVLDFVKAKIAQRLNEFKNGSGRDRLRERLSQRVAEATRSGTSDGARSADRPTTGVSHARNT